MSDQTKPRVWNAGEEVWLPVAGWESTHEVSSLGRVRSRGGRNSLGARFQGRILKQTCDRHGYLWVALCMQGRAHTKRVHRLVAETFHGAGQPGEEVRHLDGDQTNNRADNLAWGSHSVNMHDSVAHGTHSMTRRSHCPLGHMLAEPNLVMSRMVRLGQRQCLACRRAQAFRRRRGIAMGSPEFVSAAHDYYAKIMEEPNA